MNKLIPALLATDPKLPNPSKYTTNTATYSQKKKDIPFKAESAKKTYDFLSSVMKPNFKNVSSIANLIKSVKKNVSSEFDQTKKRWLGSAKVRVLNWPLNEFAHLLGGHTIPTTTPTIDGCKTDTLL